MIIFAYTDDPMYMHAILPNIVPNQFWAKDRLRERERGRGGGKGHLFAKSVIRCKKPISLTVDGGVCAPTNGIHLPMGVVIVHHMKISMSTSVPMR